jgi:hypothetical protein
MNGQSELTVHVGTPAAQLLPPPVLPPPPPVLKALAENWAQQCMHSGSLLLGSFGSRGHPDPLWSMQLVGVNALQSGGGGGGGGRT